MSMTMKRKYATIDEIQKEYLPMSKKRLRGLVKRYLPFVSIGGRMFVEREALERLLANPEKKEL